mmetsp:Transcript_138976/g.387588  ORF Transcript_138976/g.387588 Transcript_138976/m.387588 type:complete len:404 (-) Transcript_138976:176-1387(-)
MDQVDYQVNVHLILLPTPAGRQGLLAVVVDALRPRSALGDVARLDGIVDLPQGVVVRLLPLVVAALLALALATASPRQRRAEGEPLAGVLPVVVLDAVHAPGHVNRLERKVAVHLLEVPCKVISFERGTHQDNLQVLHLAGQHGLADEQQHEVRIDVALVHLVDDQAANAFEFRLRVEAPQDDGRGCVDQPRVLAEGIDEADLVAHLVAELLLAVRRHVLRQRDGRNAPGLGADHDLILRHEVLGVADELRDEGRLAAARVAADDRDNVAAHRGQDPVLALVGRHAPRGRRDLGRCGPAGLHCRRVGLGEVHGPAVLARDELRGAGAHLCAVLGLEGAIGRAANLRASGRRVFAVGFCRRGLLLAVAGIRPLVLLLLLLLLASYGFWSLLLLQQLRQPLLRLF